MQNTFLNLNEAALIPAFSANSDVVKSLNLKQSGKTAFYTPSFSAHMVTFSPWPLYASISLLLLTSSIVHWFHGVNYNLIPYLGLNIQTWVFGIILVHLVIAAWTADVSAEGVYKGDHLKKVHSGLTMGFILFIISEVCFFVSVFWAYLHSALVPTVDIGGVWPPYSINPIDPYELPLLNSGLLLSSAVSLTVSHESLIKAYTVLGKNSNSTSTTFNGSSASNFVYVVGDDGNLSKIYNVPQELHESNSYEKDALVKSEDRLLTYLAVTLLLALIFTACQYKEYSEADFTIADSVYGSVFFFGTGFHGFHVIMGTEMLAIVLLRILRGHLNENGSVGYNTAAAYYHFVDVVWLLLYLLFYWWPYD